LFLRKIPADSACLSAKWNEGVWDEVHRNSWDSNVVIGKTNDLTSILRGDVVGAYLSTTFPPLFTTDLVKFHLMATPKYPPFSDF